MGKDGALPNPVPGRTIGEHGIVGNLDTAALVASDGTIDFLCWPHLDSPTIFAALLDPDTGGEFMLAPELTEARTLQFYHPDTNVLVTRWLAEDGSAELTDLMPHPEVHGAVHCALIRRIEVTRGTVTFTMRCRPRPDYARTVPEVRADDPGLVIALPDGQAMRLSASVPLTVGDGEATARFTLRCGETAHIVLGEAHQPVPDADQVEHAIARTIDAWHGWSRKSTYRGRWREQVMRSALALKLLTSHRHGSIAAAATFGLPEATGAERNWDYRATWIRDASFTVYAFLRLGYVEEAEHFRRWMSKLAIDDDRPGHLHVMYALDGGLAEDEAVLDHLAGYAHSKPVRIGNAARHQSQLDIFGELLDSVYLSNRYASASSHASWEQITAMVEHVRKHWRDKDAGIWELRGAERHLTHSRLMCWVAVDRALRLARKRSLPVPLTRWTRLRDRIARDLWDNFRHPEHGYFVQDEHGTHLDAALLMMPLVRFVSATDPVWLATLDAIKRELADDGMIYRYRNDDGLEGGEGAFTTCTFWYVECLARAGRLSEAQVVMEKGLAYANHLGLFSEELDVRGLPLGNFPQALTHLAFISAAHFLDRRLDSPNGGEWQP
jgi:GH15 family glucan-1,4-alpha-glucosidase